MGLSTNRRSNAQETIKALGFINASPDPRFVMTNDQTISQAREPCAEEKQIIKTGYKLRKRDDSNKHKELVATNVSLETPSQLMLPNPPANATSVSTNPTFTWETNPTQQLQTFWFELDTEDTLGIAGRYTGSTLTDTTTTVFNLPIMSCGIGA